MLNRYQYGVATGAMTLAIYLVIHLKKKMYFNHLLCDRLFSRHWRSKGK